MSPGAPATAEGSVDSYLGVAAMFTRFRGGRRGSRCSELVVAAVALDSVALLGSQHSAAASARAAPIDGPGVAAAIGGGGGGRTQGSARHVALASLSFVFAHAKPPEHALLQLDDVGARGAMGVQHVLVSQILVARYAERGDGNLVWCISVISPSVESQHEYVICRVRVGYRHGRLFCHKLQ